MVPGARFDKPGKSPFMDMELVPVYADEEAGGPAVQRRSSVLRRTSASASGRSRTVRGAATASARSAASPSTSIAWHSCRRASTGYVTRLHVKAPLERVRRGQPLADIVAPEWLAAEEEYLALLDAESARGRSIRDAARRRLLVLGVPEAAIRRIETERRTSDTAQLVAPIDGVVTELAVREGAAFTAGSALFRINGLETVWVNAQVPEAQVSMIPTRRDRRGACDRLARRDVQRPRRRAAARGRSGDAHAAGARRDRQSGLPAGARHVRLARIRRRRGRAAASSCRAKQ